MKSLFETGCMALAFAGLTGLASAQEGGCPASGQKASCPATQMVATAARQDQDEAKPADIVDTAAGAGAFNTLVAAVKAAELVETLKSEGPFTVFAPTDEAFAKLPEGTVEELLKPENRDKLVAILTYHVVSGAVMAKDVVGLSEAKTAQGQPIAIEVRDENVFLNGSTRILKTDIACSNGVIHVIDSVLLPPAETHTAMPKNIIETAVEAGSFSTLAAAIEAAGLGETLMGEGPFTVFAPTDEAFAKLPEGTVEELLKPENKDKLVAILTYHVVPGKVLAADVVNLTEATSAEGSPIAIKVDEGKVLLNGSSQVIATDVECANGVIHVIDSVILPPGK